MIRETSYVDTLAFAADLAPLELIISHHNNSLRIAVPGAADRVDAQTWYNGAANQIEVIRAGDGRQLLNTQSTSSSRPWPATPRAG